MNSHFFLFASCVVGALFAPTCGASIGASAVPGVEASLVVGPKQQYVEDGRPVEGMYTRKVQVAIKNGGAQDRCNAVISLGFNGGTWRNMRNMKPSSTFGRYNIALKFAAGTTNSDAGFDYVADEEGQVSVRLISVGNC